MEPVAPGISGIGGKAHDNRLDRSQGLDQGEDGVVVRRHGLGVVPGDAGWLGIDEKEALEEAILGGAAETVKQARLEAANDGEDGVQQGAEVGI